LWNCTIRSPEIFENRPYTEKCDIWSFGVIAFILLTGCFPFASSEADPNLLPALIRSAQYDKNILAIRRISLPACSFIEKIFQIDAKLRPTASELLVDPWMIGIDMPDVDLMASAGSLASIPRTPTIGDSSAIS